MRFSAVLLRLLALAVAVQNARRLRTSDGGAEVDLSQPPSPPLLEETAFRSYCANLSPAQLYMAAMVMYAGRGDFGEEFDLLDRYQQMSDTFHSPDWAIGQMLGKFPLPEYLAGGVRRLDALGADLDGLC